MLLWSLEYGDPERLAFLEAQITPERVPRPLQNRPLLLDDAQPYWDAFCYLSRQRPSGQSISGVELNAYLQRRLITDPDEAVTYERMIDALDREYLRWYGERRESQTGGGRRTTPAELPRLPKP